MFGGLEYQKLFVCQNCNKSYAQKEDLNRHVQEKRGKEEITDEETIPKPAIRVDKFQRSCFFRIFHTNNFILHLFIQVYHGK